MVLMTDRRPTPSFSPKFNKGDRVRLIIDVNRGMESYKRGRIFTIGAFIREEESQLSESTINQHLYSVLGTNVGFYDVEFITTTELSPEDKKSRMDRIINKLIDLEEDMTNSLPKDLLGTTPNKDFVDDVNFISDVKTQMLIKRKGNLLEGLSEHQIQYVNDIMKRWFPDAEI